MASVAAYAATPRAAVGTITTTAVQNRANTTGSAGAGLVTMFTAGASGSRVDGISFAAHAGEGSGTDSTASTAANLYLYTATSTTASTAKFYKEVQITAQTPSTSSPAWSGTLTNLGLILPASGTIFGGVSVSPAVNIDYTFTQAGDF